MRSLIRVKDLAARLSNAMVLLPNGSPRLARVNTSGFDQANARLSIALVWLWFPWDCPCRIGVSVRPTLPSQAPGTDAFRRCASQREIGVHADNLNRISRLAGRAESISTGRKLSVSAAVLPCAWIAAGVCSVMASSSRPSKLPAMGFGLLRRQSAQSRHALLDCHAPAPAIGDAASIPACPGRGENGNRCRYPNGNARMNSSVSSNSRLGFRRETRPSHRLPESVPDRPHSPGPPPSPHNATAGSGGASGASTASDPDCRGRCACRASLLPPNSRIRPISSASQSMGSIELSRSRASSVSRKIRRTSPPATGRLCRDRGPSAPG